MLEGAAFRIETSVEGQAHSIALWGELDSATADSLSRAFEQALDGGAADLRLDMREVSFVDSAGMRTLITIEHVARERGIPLAVAAPPQAVTELLQRAGLAGRLDLRPTAHAPEDREYLERAEIELPSLPHAPASARAEVRELLGGRLDEAQLGITVLLTSELVTNAVVHPAHSGSPIALRATIYEDGVRIEVADAGSGFDPAELSASARAVGADTATGGGRGLFLVDQCAARWGAQRKPGELGLPFVVWFELDVPGEAEQLSA